MRETLLLYALAISIYAAECLKAGKFWQSLRETADNSDYLALSGLISGRGTTTIPHHFWGLPLTIVFISKTLHISMEAALSLISVASGMATCVLLYRLFGGWVAAWFSVVSAEWIRFSVSGQSEPLFMCLLVASFVAFRQEQWALAGLLASFATAVRPVGGIAIVCFVLILLARDWQWKAASLIILVSLCVVASYLFVVWRVAGDPLLSLKLYSKDDWNNSYFPLSFPFLTLGSITLSNIHGTRWTHWIQGLLWPWAMITCAVFACIKVSIGRASEFASEALFLLVYMAFLVSYNAEHIAPALARLLIPALPFTLFALRAWIPHDRRTLFAVAALSTLMAASSAIGFRGVFGFHLP